MTEHSLIRLTEEFQRECPAAVAEGRLGTLLNGFVRELGLELAGTVFLAMETTLSRAGTDLSPELWDVVKSLPELCGKQLIEMLVAEMERQALSEEQIMAACAASVSAFTDRLNQLLANSKIKGQA